MKKQILFAIACVFLCFSVTSCENDLTQVSSPIDVFEEDLTDWESQLAKIINDPPLIMKESNIRLLAYEIVDDIDNNAKLSEYVAKVKEGADMIPFYADDMKSVKAVAKNKIPSLRPNNKVEYTFSKRDEYIESVMSTNMKVLRLSWDNDGVKTNTLCVVSEDTGIVYDDFILNTIEIQSFSRVIIHDDSPESETIPMVKTRSEVGGYYSGWCTWEYNTAGLWLWGSERGAVTIIHNGYYRSGYYDYHNFHADHYCALGSSDAKVVALSASTISYGWGLATCLVSINITFYGPHFDVSFGGAFGSTMGGTGQHSWPYMW